MESRAKTQRKTQSLRNSNAQSRVHGKRLNIEGSIYIADDDAGVIYRVTRDVR